MRIKIMSRKTGNGNFINGGENIKYKLSKISKEIGDEEGGGESRVKRYYCLSFEV